MTCTGVIPGTFIACGESDGDCTLWCSEECQREGYRREGAAVAFGIVGMFEAIRSRDREPRTCGDPAREDLGAP